MAHIYQGAGAEDTTSGAEEYLLKAFKKLPNTLTIIHSAKWITHNSRQHGTVGEADFVIAHPRYGVLILEVKGGQITIERNKWYSTGRGGQRYPIQDPFAQADRNRYGLTDWLRADGRTKAFTYPIFSAVAFPDATMPANLRPDAPTDIVLDSRDMPRLEAAIMGIFQYWQKKYPHPKMDGKQAVQALVELLVPTTTLQTNIAAVFERERQKIDELTQQQFRVLRMLRQHRRAAIVGGAGTGKTMLAMEKAQQLAEAGFRVLFLCFNRNLANWLGTNLIHENIQVSTFHGLVGLARNWARLGTWHVKASEFYQRAPDVLLDAISIIRTPDSGATDKLFDAVIVDEAQDFEDTWWIPIRDLLKDPEQGVFYVFFDDNQRIYTQVSDVPMETDPFHLDENCRNTQHIHRLLMGYTEAEGVCIGPEGRPVEHIAAASEAETRRELQRILDRLVNTDGVHTRDIVVLTPAAEKRSQWKEDDQLGNFLLTWKMDTQIKQAIRVSTIHSFKGLENAVVILTELDRRRTEISDQLIYVGLSRARHHVVVIGELPQGNN